MPVWDDWENTDVVDRSVVRDLLDRDHVHAVWVDLPGFVEGQFDGLAVETAGAVHALQSPMVANPDGPDKWGHMRLQAATRLEQNDQCARLTDPAQLDLPPEEVFPDAEPEPNYRDDEDTVQALVGDPFQRASTLDLDDLQGMVDDLEDDRPGMDLQMFLDDSTHQALVNDLAAGAKDRAKSPPTHPNTRSTYVRSDDSPASPHDVMDALKYSVQATDDEAFELEVEQAAEAAAERAAQDAIEAGRESGQLVDLELPEDRDNLADVLRDHVHRLRNDGYEPEAILVHHSVRLDLLNSRTHYLNVPAGATTDTERHAATGIDGVQVLSTDHLEEGEAVAVLDARSAV